MQKHDLIQGSPEWHAHRLNHFNASDAPAMMGCSPYKTRDALLLELHTGLSADVSAETQRVFNEGHRAEALARPLAEEIIGEELYPVTGTNGKLSASFDGLTMLDDVAFEHKSLNNDLRAVMVGDCKGSDLPLNYQVQMEQQCMVAGCERVLFMASKWDREGNLIEERHCWYDANPELAARITAGWAQLEEDLCAYTPPERAEIVVAAPVTALPAVSVQVSGSIAIRDNFKAFKTAIRDFLEHRLIREPKTDQDFADLDTQIKAMKGAEAALESAEAQMLAQIESVDSAKKTKDMLHKLVRDNRLMAEKLLASEKERRKTEIVQIASVELRDHIAALNARLGHAYMPAIAADFAGAIRGKKSIDSMQEAVNQVLAGAKIDASTTADRITINLATLRELAGDHKALFNDTATIVLKAPDDLTALVKSRIADHKAEEEARIQREIAARQAEIDRQTEAARLQAERIEAARQQRISARFEDIATKRGYSAATPSATIDAAILQLTSVPPCEDTFGDRLEEGNAAHAATLAHLQAILPQSIAREQAEDVERLAQQAAAESTARAAIVPVASPVTQVREPDPAPVADEQPTLTLGTINSRLGFTVTADFLTGLGFTPTQVKAARLFRESQFGAICSAIADHALKVAAVKSLEKAA